MDKKIIVVIPCYKAAATLPSVLERIPPETYKELYKIVLVEDGGRSLPPSSTPELLAKYPMIEVIWHEENRGYGGAQKSGFTRAVELGADVAVLLHSDGQYAPEIMSKLYAPLVADECDIVLGSRMIDKRGALAGGMPLYKWIANIALTSLENLCYGTHLSEFHSGYMLYNRKALTTIPFVRLSNTYHFDGEMLLVGSKKKLRIKDIGIPTHYGDEESHLKPIQYGFDVLKIICRSFAGDYDFK